MNHARDSSTSFQDDRRTRKCANRPQQKPLPGPGEPRKVARGDSQERPRAPSGPPSDTPRSSPEPPSRAYANGCRGSTNSALPARAPGTGGATQPPPLIIYVQTLHPSRSRLPALPGLPPRRTRGVGGFYWAAPTAADPESGVPTKIPCEVLKAHGSTVRRTLTC